MMKILLVEPSWGEVVLKKLNFWANNEIFKSYIPWMADGVVFLYPIFLIGFYGWGIIAKDRDYKKYAILIFLGVVLSVVITLLIQTFVIKARPENFLNHNMLLLKHFPSISFPSDHATVGFAMAFGVILSGIRLKRIWLLRSGYLFLILAALMGIARVGAGVHWPTDILAGLVVAALGVWLVFKNETIWAKPINFLIWLEGKTLGILFEKIFKRGFRV